MTNRASIDIDPFGTFGKMDPNLGYSLSFSAVGHGDSTMLICFLGVCFHFHFLCLFVGYQSLNVFSL